MKYINGNDFPFEVKQMILDSLERNEPVIITTVQGQLVALPVAEYNRLKAASTGAYTEGMNYYSEEQPSGLDDFAFMNRDEIDY